MSKSFGVGPGSVVPWWERVGIVVLLGFYAVWWGLSGEKIGHLGGELAQLPSVLLDAAQERWEMGTFAPKTLQWVLKSIQTALFAVMLGLGALACVRLLGRSLFLFGAQFWKATIGHAVAVGLAVLGFILCDTRRFWDFVRYKEIQIQFGMIFLIICFSSVMLYCLRHRE